MGRQYVHYSPDQATAKEVGRRKGGELILLGVQALRAAETGLAFYRGNDKVWLSGPLSPEFLTFDS